MNKTQKEINEEKSAAASYIMQFYNEVIILTNTYANYQNMLLEFKTKVTNGAKGGITEQERKGVSDLCHAVRYYCTKTYIGYTTINMGLKQKDKSEISDTYAEIKEQFVIKLDSLEKYVKALNAFLLTEIVKNLLQNSEQLVDSLYNEKLADEQP